MHWWQRMLFLHFWLGNEVYELNWIKNSNGEYGIIIFMGLSPPRSFSVH